MLDTEKIRLSIHANGISLQMDMNKHSTRQYTSSFLLRSGMLTWDHRI